MNSLGLAILLIFGTSQVIAEDDVCDFRNGDYTILRFDDGEIYLFKGDRYYTFFPGNITYANASNISDLIICTDINNPKIDQTFMFNGKTYYIRGDDTVIDFNGSVSQESWKSIKSSIPHLVIIQNGQTTGFFVPLYTSDNIQGEHHTAINNIQLIAFHGDSVSSSIDIVNGVNIISYDGYKIPDQFNTYFINFEDYSVTFFNGDKYTVVKHNDDQSHNDENAKNRFEWKDVNQYFGC